MSKVIINNPLEQFEIMKLLGMEGPLFGYIQIALTNFSVSLLIVVFFLISLHLLFAKGKPVGHRGLGVPLGTPGGLTSLPPHKPAPLAPHGQGNPYSSLMESYFGLVLSIVRGQVGSKGMLYLPAAYSLFLFLLGCNLLGLVPYSFCATAQFALTLSLSFTIIIGVTVLGLYLHGIHFFSLFVPSGTPLGLVPLLVLIESISYLARTISLGVRLSANLISGHILLKIISTFTWNFIVSGSLLAFILAPLPILFLTLLFMLEFGVALLQGYVFVVLTLSYMADAIFLHDESANSSSHNSPPPRRPKGHHPIIKMVGLGRGIRPSAYPGDTVVSPSPIHLKTIPNSSTWPTVIIEHNHAPEDRRLQDWYYVSLTRGFLILFLPRSEVVLQVPWN